MSCNKENTSVRGVGKVASSSRKKQQRAKEKEGLQEKTQRGRVMHVNRREGETILREGFGSNGKTFKTVKTITAFAEMNPKKRTKAHL